MVAQPLPIASMYVKWDFARLEASQQSACAIPMRIAGGTYVILGAKLNYREQPGVRGSLAVGSRSLHSPKKPPLTSYATTQMGDMGNRVS